MIPGEGAPSLYPSRKVIHRAGGPFFMRDFGVEQLTDGGRHSIVADLFQGKSAGPNGR